MIKYNDIHSFHTFISYVNIDCIGPSSKALPPGTKLHTCPTPAPDPGIEDVNKIYAHRWNRRLLWQISMRFGLSSKLCSVE